MNKKLVLSFAVLVLVALVPLVMADNDAFSTAQTQYQQAKQTYLQSLQAFKNLQETWKGLRADTKAENESAEAINAAKQFLTAAAQRGIAHISLVEAWVDKLNLSSDEQSSLTSTLEADKTALNNELPVIAAAQTKQDLINASQTLRQLEVKRVADFKVVAMVGLNQRIGHIITRMDNLKDRLDNITQRMQAAGVDTSSIAPLVSQFNTYIANAQADYQKAQSILTSGNSTPGNVDNLVQEARSSIRDAIQNLQQAHQTLVQIVQQLRQERQSIRQERRENATTSVNATRMTSNATNATGGNES